MAFWFTYAIRGHSLKEICEGQTLLCPLASSFKASLQTIISSHITKCHLGIVHKYAPLVPSLLWDLAGSSHLIVLMASTESLAAIFFFNWSWRKMNSVFSQILLLDTSPSLSAFLPLPALQGSNMGPCAWYLGLLLWMLMMALSSTDFSKHTHLSRRPQDHSRILSMGYFPCFYSRPLYPLPAYWTKKWYSF